MRNYGYTEENKAGSVGDIRLWQRILAQSRGYFAAIAAAVILSLIVTVGTLALPYLIKTGIDTYITATSPDSAQRSAGLTRIGLVFVLLVIMVFIVTFIQVVLLEWVGQCVMHRIRQRLFSHILDLDLAFLDRQPTGRLVTRLTNDVQNMHEMFTSVMVTLFNDFLRLFGILCVLFLINSRLALLMTVFVPVSLFITVIFARFARAKFSAIRRQLSRLNSFIQESVSGIAVIQAFGRQKETDTAFRSLSLDYLHRTFAQIRLFSAFMPLTELLSSIAIALILWYGGGEIIRDNLSLGELVAFLAYMRLFFQPLRELAQKYSIVQSALASAERIFEMLDKKPSITNPKQPLQLPHIKGEIAFENISFGYDRDSTTVAGISFTAAPGETIAVVGTTGSGKTTLINLLLRFYEPQEGRITLDSIDIKDLRLQDLRNSVGVILQDVFILQDTLLANIVMNTGASRIQVEKLLTETKMDRFVSKLPDGLDTPIGDGGHELSTGEKQLLSFARALCRNPAILVLDEATASIDSVTETILEEAVERGFSGRTSIVIAHRLSTIRRVDRIFVMEKGRIIEEGSHEELIDKQANYARLIKLDLLLQPK